VKLTVEKQRAAAEAAVKRGIAWLDAHKREWRKRIDIESLDLQYPCACVLGQLEGDFFQAAWEHDIDRVRAGDLGLAAPSGVSYRTLTAAWRRALKEVA
jgi:hypothetical protein